MNAQTNGIKGALQYRNDDRVWIVVEDINPFVATYTLKVKRQPVAENAISLFLSDLGGIDAGIVPSQKSPDQTAQAPPPNPAPELTGKKAAPPPPPPACDPTPLNRLIAKFKTLMLEEKKVNDTLNFVAAKYKTDATTYSNLLSTVKGEQHCAGIKASASPLRQFLAAVQSPDQLKASDFGGVPSASDPIQVLRGSVAQLASDGKAQRQSILDYKRSAIVNATCLRLLDANRDNLDEQDKFIDGLIGPTSGTSEVQALTDQLNKLKTIYGQWSDSHLAVEKLFDPARSGNPFALTYSLIDNQSDDEITLQTAPAVLASPETGNVSTPKTAGSQGAATPPPAFDTTIHFGYGARFSLGGGLVVSFLQNRQFTTANGQIVYQNNSQTRILPIAVLNSRFHDCNPDARGCLWIPQISVGITAKADDKGTAPEYLIGPSWALLRRQLFLTVGAYAGQQQRLLGGLQVGQTTSLSAANLPVAKEYHWSGAFAITWKVK
ncbi:MAG: hypothetical protein WAN12_15015 [Candidatus Acidiferrum sp.]